MKAKANLFRSLVVVLPVMLVAVAVALFGVGLRTAETQTTSYYYEVQDLGTFPWALGAGYGSYSSPSDINSLGHVVGVSGYRSDFEPQYHAFLYKDGQMKDLGTLGSDFSSATAINDFDQIVRASYSAYYGEVHAFLYEDGQMKDLGDLGGDYNPEIGQDRANGINASGQVVEQSLKSSKNFHAFLYRGEGPMQDLGDLVTSGEGASGATAINDFDQIVGASNNDHSIYRYDTTAFLYQNEEMIDLETRLLPDDNGSV
jgi:probable HAF family extracellular repeat protein